MVVKVALLLGIVAIILISGCTQTGNILSNFQSGDSIKDISENPENYVGKEVTLRGEILRRAADYVISDSEGHYVIVDCDRVFKGGEIYTLTGVIISRELFTSRTLYYLDCEAQPITYDRMETSPDTEESETVPEPEVSEPPAQSEVIQSMYESESESNPCSVGYLTGERCSGNWIQQKYQYEDCNIDYIDVEYCSDGCENGECIEVIPCTDSDNGKDYYTKGYIVLDEEHTQEDYCGGNIVVEFYCTSSWYASQDFICSYGCSDGKCNSEPEEENVVVTRVIDGDTVDLDNGERVRLIGINTPEAGEPCYLESKQKLEDLVLGKEVTLETDVSDRDIYGRLLRYIYVSDVWVTFVNEDMIKSGYAISSPYEPDTAYSTQFDNTEDYAQDNNLGCLWKPSENDCSNCIDIYHFNYNPDGNECYNLNDEYVIFENVCSYSCDMTDWTVKDESSRDPYVFPNFILESNIMVTLYTGCGTNTNTKLYWCSSGYSCNAIWNNNGDTLYLRDSSGNLVLSQSYAGY